MSTQKSINYNIENTFGHCLKPAAVQLQDILSYLPDMRTLIHIKIKASIHEVNLQTINLMIGSFQISRHLKS